VLRARRRHSLGEEEADVILHGLQDREEAEEGEGDYYDELAYEPCEAAVAVGGARRIRG
jgi:hypothetical protein